jgi:hypothetical protein
MPFPVYIAMLSSQLIIMVADRVPEFDVRPKNVMPLYGGMLLHRRTSCASMVQKQRLWS